MTQTFVRYSPILLLTLACRGLLKDDARRRIERELDLREAQLMRTTFSGSDS